MYINIERMHDNKLYREEWIFQVSAPMSASGDLKVYLESYMRFTRKTRRHGWGRPTLFWNSHFQRNQMDKPEPPADVIADAMEALRQRTKYIG